MSGKRRGRPVIADQDRKEFTLCVRLTNEQRASVERCAVACRMSASDWIRVVVSNAILLADPDLRPGASP